MSLSRSSRAACEAPFRAPRCREIPCPKRLLSPMQLSPACGEETDNQTADRRNGDVFGEAAVSGKFVGQGFGAKGGQRSSQRGIRLVGEKEQEAERPEANQGRILPLPASKDGVPVTSLMMCNVCRRLGLADALRLLPCEVYKYDLFYLLYDIRNNRGSGRIFINFLTHSDAMAFRDQFHGKRLPMLSREDGQGIMKPIIIEAASRQGFQMQVKHWQRTLRHDMSAALLPVVFVGGVRQGFWEYASGMQAAAVRVAASSRALSL